MDEQCFYSNDCYRNKLYAPFQLWAAVRPTIGKLADLFFGLLYVAMVIASFPGAILVCRYFHFSALLRLAFATEQVSAFD